jgi:hypothetical protein
MYILIIIMYLSFAHACNYEKLENECVYGLCNSFDIEYDNATN